MAGSTSSLPSRWRHRRWAAEGAPISRRCRRRGRPASSSSRSRNRGATPMSLAHFTLATRQVQKTAAFFEETLGYPRDPIPGNVPEEAAWLNLGRGQQIHLVYVEEFGVPPFEQEFGRHVAVYYPREGFTDLKQR